MAAAAPSAAVSCSEQQISSAAESAARRHASSWPPRPGLSSGARRLHDAVARGRRHHGARHLLLLAGPADEVCHLSKPASSLERPRAWERSSCCPRSCRTLARSSERGLKEARLDSARWYAARWRARSTVRPELARSKGRALRVAAFSIPLRGPQQVHGHNPILT